MGHLEVMMMARKSILMGFLCRVGDGGRGCMVNMSVA